MELAQSPSDFGKKLEMARLWFPHIFREIYLEHIIVLIKLSIFGARYRFSYRMEKDRDISPHRCIVPPTPINNHYNFMIVGQVHTTTVTKTK